ncbi:MAG: hypothetical protein EXR97_05580 [Nitrospiraceae bacterium]|nr:hypothetical protein [Nitrospiraceae bacterium]MSR23511.1 hypothetical protein [Nitrospiraceae bacterium]
MKLPFDKSIFEEFISQTLRKFEQHLRNEQMTQNTITQRMRGATEFARFLTDRPHRYRERTAGTI